MTRANGVRQALPLPTFVDLGQLHTACVQVSLVMAVPDSFRNEPRGGEGLAAGTALSDDVAFLDARFAIAESESTLRRATEPIDWPKRRRAAELSMCLDGGERNRALGTADDTRPQRRLSRAHTTSGNPSRRRD